MRTLKILALFALCALSSRAEETPAAEEKPAEEAAAPAEGEVPAEGEGEKKEKVVGHCNKALLEAYDLESTWETVEDKNLLCPSITKLNCCSYHAQIDIFRKWVLKGEREKVLKLYR